jgi:epsilon-lactone hydrolase
MSVTAQQAARDAYTSLSNRLTAAQAGGIAAMRTVFDEWSDELFPVPPEAECEDVELGGVAGIRVRMPGAIVDRTVVHFHGGGFVIGSPPPYRAMAAAISRSCRASVVLPDYRLAPEHPPAAPVEDGLAVYRALLGGGVDPAGVFVSGDSAGGGLTVAVLTAIRDAGERSPAGGVAMSPWTDGTLSGASVTENAQNDPIVTPETLAGMAMMRFGEDGDRRDPVASPLFAELGGLPPLQLFASTIETLRDDSVRVAEKARAAGVEVELELYPDMVHVWQFFAGQLPEADQALQQMGAFIDRRAPA